MLTEVNPENLNSKLNNLLIAWKIWGEIKKDYRESIKAVFQALLGEQSGEHRQMEN